MNDNMIERVARALCKESGGKAVYWENWIADATVAIQAMRKPTPAMIKSGGTLLDDDEGRFMTDEERATRNWQAMIDTVLSEN